MDRDLLDEAIEARRVRWQAAGVMWEVTRYDGTAKPSSALRAECNGRLADLVLWMSGEADLSSAEINSGDDLTVDHYELTSTLGLNGLLDDFEDRLGISG